MLGNKKREKLYFVHIPKTAGTSFVDVVSAWFGAEHSKNYIEGIPASEHALLGDKKFLSGHLFFDDVMRLPYIDDFQLVVVLRDPYERLVSHLRYTDRYNKPEFETQLNMLPPPAYEATKKLACIDFSSPRDLERFFSGISEWERSVFDNCQTRLLACDPMTRDKHPHAKLYPGALDKACKRIRNVEYLAVAKYLLQGVNSIADGMGFDRCTTVPRSNTDSSDRTIDLQNPEIRAVLKPFVSSDLIVYELALELLGHTSMPKRLAA